jgi:cullin-associated NEDD8-dissociated protein 1
VRKAALNVLNHVIHYQVNDIHTAVLELLPLIYEETKVKPYLIREIEMGPFKHRIDDGLELRKVICSYFLSWSH